MFGVKQNLTKQVSALLWQQVEFQLPHIEGLNILLSALNFHLEVCSCLMKLIEAF